MLEKGSEAISVVIQMMFKLQTGVIESKKMATKSTWRYQNSTRTLMTKEQKAAAVEILVKLTLIHTLKVQKTTPNHATMLAMSVEPKFTYNMSAYFLRQFS